MGIANKRLPAAWNKDYLCRLIGFKPKPCLDAIALVSQGRSAIVCGGVALQDGQFLPQLVQAVLVDAGEFLNSLP